MIKFDVDVRTTFNAANPIYSRSTVKSLYGLQVAEDSIFTLGTKLDRATKEIFIPNAKRYVPKKTGDLERSIGGMVEVSSTQIYVSLQATQPYAGYVEFGSSRMSPRPYLRPAMYDAYAPILGTSFVRYKLIPNIKVWKNGSKKWKGISR
jgi:HK97 gp10 family phage protein